MDKIERREREHQRTINDMVDDDIIDKIDELVEGYNENKCRYDEIMTNYECLWKEIRRIEKNKNHIKDNCEDIVRYYKNREILTDKGLRDKFKKEMKDMNYK